MTKDRPHSRFVFIVSVIIASGFASVLFPGCSTTPPKRAEEAPTSFLFEATQGNAQSHGAKAYILGSIHLASDDLYPLLPTIEQAFEESPVLVVEADVLGIDEEEMQAMFLEKAMYRAGDSIDKHLTLDTYALLKDALGKKNMDIRSMSAFKPWSIVLTLESLEYLKLGYDPNLGIDVYFLKKAKDKKEIKELESVRFKFDLLDNFTDELDGQFLYSSLLDLEKTKDTAKQLFEYWKKGDTKNLERLMFEDIGKSPELRPLYTKLYDERNKNMTTKIEQYLATGKTHFIVVGAAHLIGKAGIIGLLKSDGYSVVQK